MLFGKKAHKEKAEELLGTFGLTLFIIISKIGVDLLLDATGKVWRPNTRNLASFSFAVAQYSLVRKQTRFSESDLGEISANAGKRMHLDVFGPSAQFADPQFGYLDFISIKNDQMLSYHKFVQMMVHGQNEGATLLCQHMLSFCFEANTDVETARKFLILVQEMMDIVNKFTEKMD